VPSRRIDLFNGSVSCDTTGRARFETWRIGGVRKYWNHVVMALDAPSGTQTHGAYGHFVVPQDYASGAKIIAQWTSSTTIGAICFNFAYRTVAGDGAASLDQTSNEQSVVPVFSIGPGEPWGYRRSAIIGLTSGNFAAGESVQFFFGRYDDANNYDTMAAIVYVHNLFFEYMA
jgi:hypothetical protein